LQEPTQLPAKGRYDHKIIPKSNIPVWLKPYKYPNTQNPEIERRIKALLFTGFVIESSSCYASPLVFVKKDGSQI
ncbi:hypothetical protein VIGAN_01415700, partial [Vigna angularis var. angularis]